MSSPLDGRIRAIAREEATALLADGAPAAEDAVGVDRLTALEQEVVDLRGALKRAFARLDVLDQAPDAVPQESRPVQRRTRKTAEPSE